MLLQGSTCYIKCSLCRDLIYELKGFRSKSILIGRELDYVVEYDLNYIFLISTISTNSELYFQN